VSTSSKHSNSSPSEQKKKFWKRRAFREAARTVPLISLAVLAAGAANVHADKICCDRMKVEVEHVEGMYFTDANQIQTLLLTRHDVVGTPMSELPLNALHQTLMGQPSVARAQVVPHLSGTLEIKIEQHRPIARLVMPEGSFYLESKGGTMPLSSNYSAPVPVIHCPSADAAMQALPLLNRMRVDPFWDAMIDQISVNEKGEVALIPRVGQLTIQLGHPSQFNRRLDQQLSDIQKFYRAQIATGDLRKYKQLDLSFAGQVVARK